MKKITCLFCNHYAKFYSGDLHWCRRCDVQYKVINLSNGEQSIYCFNIKIETKYVVHYDLYKKTCFINFYDQNHNFIQIKDIAIDKMLIHRSELKEKINTILAFI